MKKIAFLFALCFLVGSGGMFAQKNVRDFTVRDSIPLGGNAFQVSSKSDEDVTEGGIENWRDRESEYAIYFYSPKKSKARLIIPLINQKSNSVLSVVFNRKKTKVTVIPRQTTIDLGIKRLVKGYNKLTLRGISKDENRFATIGHLLLEQNKNQPIYYVRTNQNNGYYFGRRGPSAHLNYVFPENTEVKWFYNEVTVPRKHDPIGAYYMANGFDGGYFGIQRNTENERRILFSVWSPFETNDPASIPESDRVKLLKKGEGVTIGEFGDEGSGGQSYKRYDWKAGKTYKFLNSVVPDGKGNAIFTAYFMDPAVGKWELIASFLRPKTTSHYKGAYSFLENFEPTRAHITAKYSLVISGRVM